MPTLTSYTEFVVGPAVGQAQETADLILLPEIRLGDQTRRLTYPGGIFPPIIYQDLPDELEHFDTVPLTFHPQAKTERTLAGTQTVSWPGYRGDRPVVERWRGDQNRARMTMYFLRRLLEYYLNQPKSGYITWTPYDLTDTAYQVVIEGLSVDGADVIKLNTIAHYHGLVLGVVELRMRIIGEVRG